MIILDQCVTNNVIERYMFDQIGYYLKVIFEEQTCTCEFYINNNIQPLCDGIRVFNKKQLLKYADILIETFELLAKYRNMNGMSAIIHLGEYVPHNNNVLCFCKKDDEKGILIYSPDVMQHVLQRIPYNNQNYNTNWNLKIPKAIFRGSLSGLINHQNVRYISNKLSDEYPDLLDAKLLHKDYYYLVQNNKYVRYTVKQSKNNYYIDMEQQTNYKYILLLDGFVAPWRTVWALNSGSTILKQDSSYKELYYDELLPYFHYIPIKSDLSDLIDKIIWCQNNDSAAKNIANNALCYAQSKFTLENIFDKLEFDIKKLNEISAEYITIDEIGDTL